ncbi:MAG: thiol-disulfide oxidoreductase DCC family protein [Bacteroidia bacterium]|nr:thiol-disulfide oxidoreductase DCC family protein [Bacteroidia bacterium]
MTDDELHNIVLFDGVCNLCNGSVQFIIRHDPLAKFRFASLQSQFGQQILNKIGKNHTEFQSIILLWRGQSYEQSTAVLKIAGQLNGLWPVLTIFRIVPRFIRDAVYSWISKNRYRFFGRQEACMIPTPALKSRFLE